MSDLLDLPRYILMHFLLIFVMPTEISMQISSMVQPIKEFPLLRSSHRNTIVAQERVLDFPLIEKKSRIMGNEEMDLG